MSGIATAIVGSALVGGTVAMVGSSKAAKASKSAAQTSAQASMAATDATLQGQREQLEYLKEVDKLPREYREQALTQLSETYLGPEGFQYPEGQLLDQAKNSEMFAMLRDQGSDAVLRHASATGGLRSGGVQEALAENQQQALLQSYNQQQKQYEMGLQGVASLANLPLQTTNIANTMGNMAQTSGAGISAAGSALAQGTLGAGQAYQQGLQGLGDTVQSSLGMFANAKGQGWI